MADFSLVDGTYPNGQRYQAVSLDGVALGHLIETENGFTTHGWRKPAATKDAALEKLRLAAIAERKRQIEKLQSEIDKLGDLNSKKKDK